jgi:hypothetical protein
MPGLSFLLKKTFHPGRLDNQEKVWVRENNAALEKERNVKLAVERLKEQELARYEQMLTKEGHEVDKRGTDLRFMYSMPKPEGKKQDKTTDAGKEIYPSTGAGDDDAVRKFRASFNSSSSSSSEPYGESLQTSGEDANYCADGPGLPGADDKRIPKRKRDITQKERFPFLRNAPVEGDLAKMTEGKTLCISCTSSVPLLGSLKAAKSAA